MVTDQQVRRLFDVQNRYEYQYQVADAAGISRKTAHKYLTGGKLPSHCRVEHTWPTRQDPFADDWTFIEQLLKDTQAALEAKTLFDHLQRAYCTHSPRAGIEYSPQCTNNPNLASWNHPSLLTESRVEFPSADTIFEEQDDTNPTQNNKPIEISFVDTQCPEFSDFLFIIFLSLWGSTKIIRKISPAHSCYCSISFSRSLSCWAISG